MAKLKIFLSGGSGFIGRNLLEQLGSKYQFVAPSHRQLDILDKSAVRDFLKNGKFDLVIHAANIGGKRSQRGMPGVFEANKKMFLNLAENSSLFGRMIFLGSGAEYDKRQDLKSVREEDFGKSTPADKYGFSKYFCSKYIETAKNIINLRCFAIYGKYEDQTQRFISSTILDALAGKPIIIRQKNVWFDYLYADDLVKIIDYFIKHKPRYKFYNVASGQRVDLLSLARIVERISGSKKGIIVQKDGLNKEYTADNSRLMGEIPKLKLTSLEDGIRKLFRYYSAIK